KEQRLREYARRADAVDPMKALAQADALPGQARADQQQYEALRQAAGGAGTAEAINRAEAKAEEYLSDRRHGQAMAGAVRPLQGTTAAFKKPRTVYITVKGVHIPRGFLHTTWTGNPRVSVRVTVGDTTHRTSQLLTQASGRDFTGHFGTQLGPFRV